MERQIIYLEHENEIRLQLLNDGVPQDLSNVTQISATFGDDTVYSSDAAAGAIRWADGSEVSVTFEGTDGAAVDLTGEAMFRPYLNTGDTFAYQTRDGRKVIRYTGTSTSYSSYLLYQGALALQNPMLDSGSWEFKVLAYLEDSFIGIDFIGSCWAVDIAAAMFSPGGGLGITEYCQIYDPGWSDYSDSAAKAHAAGWWWLKFRVEWDTPAIRCRSWADGTTEPGTWDLEVDTMPEMWGPIPLTLVMRFTNLSSGIVDIAELGWQAPIPVDEVFVTGEIRLHMEDELLTAGDYTTQLVVYDAPHPEGIVWGSIPTQVVEEFENPP